MKSFRMQIMDKWTDYHKHDNIKNQKGYKPDFSPFTPLEASVTNVYRKLDEMENVLKSVRPNESEEQRQERLNFKLKPLFDELYKFHDEALKKGKVKDGLKTFLDNYPDVQDFLDASKILPNAIEKMVSKKDTMSQNTKRFIQEHYPSALDKALEVGVPLKQAIAESSKKREQNKKQQQKQNMENIFAQNEINIDFDSLRHTPATNNLHLNTNNFNNITPPPPANYDDNNGTVGYLYNDNGSIVQYHDPNEYNSLVPADSRYLTNYESAYELPSSTRAVANELSSMNDDDYNMTMPQPYNSFAEGLRQIRIINLQDKAIELLKQYNRLSPASQKSFHPDVELLISDMVDASQSRGVKNITFFKDQLRDEATTIARDMRTVANQEQKEKTKPRAKPVGKKGRSNNAKKNPRVQELDDDGNVVTNSPSNSFDGAVAKGKPKKKKSNRTPKKIVKARTTKKPVAKKKKQVSFAQKGRGLPSGISFK